MPRLEAEQICVGSRPRESQNQALVIHVIDQQPVGLNVTLTMPPPLTSESMIPMHDSKLPACSQRSNNPIQTIHVEPALHRTLVVALKLRCPNDFQRH